MKNKLLLTLSLASLLAITQTINCNHSIRVKAETNSITTTSRSLTKTQFNTYVNNSSWSVVFIDDSIDSAYIYYRYDLSNSVVNGEKYFLNISVMHNADLADTVIEFSSLTFTGISYTQGFGYSLEGSTPGLFCSYAEEMSCTTSVSNTVVDGRSYRLKGKKHSNYDESGLYYLYFRETFVDSIIVKMTKNKEFVSAEYYQNAPRDTFNLELLRTRPTTDASVLPSC